jgi:membrane protein
MNIKNIWSLLQKTFSAWNAHDAPRMGAALAFYSILSLAPLVVLAVTIVGLAFGDAQARQQIATQAESLIGKEGGDAVRSMLQSAHKPAEGIIAAVIGIVTLIFGASGVFGELQEALNRMWDVSEKPKGGIWAKVRQRLFSFGMVLAVGFLLLVSLLLSACLAAAGKFLSDFLPLPEFALHIADFLFSLASISLLFALIFKYVPDAQVPMKDVWLGAAATALLFTIGKFLIGLYLGKAAVGSAYGAAGSFVVVVVWIYYSAMIFLFGAEFTHMLATAPETPLRSIRIIHDNQ